MKEPALPQGSTKVQTKDDDDAGETQVFSFREQVSVACQGWARESLRLCRVWDHTVVGLASWSLEYTRTARQSHMLTFLLHLPAGGGFFQVVVSKVG